MPRAFRLNTCQGPDRSVLHTDVLVHTWEYCSSGKGRNEFFPLIDDSYVLTSIICMSPYNTDMYVFTMYVLLYDITLYWR